MKNIILAEAKKKTGNPQIHLQQTPNNKARVIIGNRLVKDFGSQTDALLWLIYSYNLKHLKTLWDGSCMKQAALNPVAKTPDTVDDAARKIFSKLANYDYYDFDLMEKIVGDIRKSKIKNGYSEEETGYVYGIILDELKKLLDETTDYRSHQTYQRYYDQLKSRDPRKY